MQPSPALDARRQAAWRKLWQLLLTPQPSGVNLRVLSGGKQDGTANTGGK